MSERRENEGEEERQREGEEREKKKRFECGVCLELMSWEKEPKILPCCGLSFCTLCLNKLFLLRNPSTPSSSSSSSSSSCPSSEKKKKGVKCPVCRKVNECERIETLDTNYLIPETIDILLSSNVVISSSSSKQQPTSEGERNCMNFESCGKQTRMYCSDCKHFICDSCDSFHSTSIFSRNHKRTEQQIKSCGDDGDSDDGDGDDDESGLEKLKKRECSKHPPELVWGYCFQCSSLACVCCLLETHDDHNEKVKSVKESVLEKRNEVVKIGDGLEKRLIEIEEERKRIEEEMKELEEKLEKKRIEKKEIELEKEDLRIRKDSIIRLSNTSTDVSLFDDQLFSTLLQTAKEIVSEGGIDIVSEGGGGGGFRRKKGVICCDGGGDSFCFISSFPLRYGSCGVSVNSDGNIFICGYEGGLRVRDKEGNVVEPLQKTIDSLQLEPFDVSIGLSDQIVVLDRSRDSYQVVILNKEGELMKSFGSKGSEDGQFWGSEGVDVDREGRIIVADTHNHRIQVFDNDGSFIRSFGSKGSFPGQFNFPCSVAANGDGNIVVSDWGNHRIEVMDIEGNFIRCFGTKGSGDSQLNYPRSVDGDEEGRIVVCEGGNQRVSVFEKDGTFLFSFGKGRMKKPYGVVVDSFGSIIVSDWREKSIELWK